MNLEGKKIVLCISGSIAAYKTPELIRCFVKQGATIKVVCTQAALKFVSVLSLSTVANNEVLYDFENNNNWNNHVDLGRWADVIIVAPCSANTLAKLAHGICDNILLATCLSATCPIIIAPAMDEDMWLHPSTQTNLEVVKKYNYSVIPVAHGFLASGIIGLGRMADIDEIIVFTSQFLNSNNKLLGLNVLISAGPTYEKLDPVRYIGNFSTGKMGVAFAEVIANMGANVTLVLGPSSVKIQNSKIKVINVMSAEEMYQACTSAFKDNNLCIMSAAVADYKPLTIADEKIKKNEPSLHLELVKNKDILATLGAQKNKNQVLIGFALETENELAHAKSKLAKKNTDIIILNSLKDEGAGFSTDTNKVTIISKSGDIVDVPLQSKKDIAKYVVEYVIKNFRLEKNV